MKGSIFAIRKGRGARLVLGEKRRVLGTLPYPTWS